MESLLNNLIDGIICLGLLMALPKGQWLGIGNGRSRRQAGKAIIKILEYARKIPKILIGWGNF